jgi:hypothetical protein
MRPNPPTPPGRGTQIEVERRDGSPVRRWKCSRCVIQYDSVEAKPRCPLCVQEIKTEQMREALKVATNKLEQMEKQLKDLDARQNLQSAFHAALDICNDKDLVFLKSVLYRWRADRSITMKTMGVPKPRGFIAEPRRGEPESHVCSSIGGLAVAAYYQEALRTVGSAQAMAILLRAAQHLLPGEMA